MTFIAKFGIDEIYFHSALSDLLLEKLYQRAAICLDAEDDLIQKYVAHDMILIFQRQSPNQSLIYRFIKTLAQDPHRDNFIKDNTLLNEEELFSAIKSKRFVLITYRTLVKESIK